MLPEPEALLGVAGPEGAQHDRGHGQHQDQHQGQVKVPLFRADRHE